MCGWGFTSRCPAEHGAAPQCCSLAGAAAGSHVLLMAGSEVCAALCIYRAALAAAIGLSSGGVGVSLVCPVIVGICGQRGAGLYVIRHGPGLQ